MYCAIYSSNGYSGSGVSYSCHSIAEAINAAGIATSVFVPWQTKDAQPVRYAKTVPKFLIRRGTHKPIKAIQELMYFQNIVSSRDSKKFAYLWPDASLYLVTAIKSRGIPMVREMVNCHVATAKNIMDQAALERGISDWNYIAPSHINYENQILELVDKIFAPSENVVNSLLENGIPESKILRTSFGWHPSRMKNGVEAANRVSSDGVNVLAVGTLCLRKGTDILIDAWKMSGVSGRLSFLGDLQNDVRQKVEQSVSDSIVHLPFTSDVSKVFHKADMLVVPSLEEGSPLVSYEAAGVGLPIIATPMGGDPVVRNGINGIIIPPGDVNALSKAIRTLAMDMEKRFEFSKNSISIAKQYDWSVVGRTRAELIKEALF